MPNVNEREKTMIITVRTKEESNLAKTMLERFGFAFATSYFYTQEWRKGGDVVLLHKDEDWRKINKEYDWRLYQEGRS